MFIGPPKGCSLKLFLKVTFIAIVFMSLTACDDLNTLTREIKKKAQSKFGTLKKKFEPRDGITTRRSPIYQTANPNSEILGHVPAETPVRLVDRIGDWYKARTRDGREGYLNASVVAGKEIIRQTRALKRSIEGMPVQAEGVIKNKANFRLEPGRKPKVMDLLRPGLKLEIFERVVTIKESPLIQDPQGSGGLQGNPIDLPEEDEQDETRLRKDVWYKVKLEDGRVGYVYTHNIQFTPPDEIAKIVPYMRVLAWRPISVTDDPDRGAKNNYVAAYAPVGKDPGCDYTHLYLIMWSKRYKRHDNRWWIRLSGVLPIGNFSFEGKPGFSVRYLHPSKPDKLVMAGYVLSRGKAVKVSEEEIPAKRSIH
jgi:hypothetical protein